MTETPFGDLDEFFALPRVSGLAVSPDGARVVTTISELKDDAEGAVRWIDIHPDYAIRTEVSAILDGLKPLR